MNHIKTTNVNEGLAVAMNVLFREGGNWRTVSPRGIETRELKGVTVVDYSYPWERVLFDVTRDANPFFHLLESMWILRGRRDVKFTATLLPKFAEYSDDGVTFHGAYGHRLFMGNQIDNVITTLLNDRDSRRAVAAIWQPDFDSDYEGKDMPCNIALTFKVRETRLNMTVYNRSNDLIWGALGANAVQFPFIAEYVAAGLGLQDFTMTQVTDSMHIYPANEPTKTLLEKAASFGDPYLEGILVDGNIIMPDVKHLVELGEDESVLETDRDLEDLFDLFDDHAGLVELDRTHFRTYFFRDVIAPMWNTYALYKEGRVQEATDYIKEELDSGNNTDWIIAGYLWMKRRLDKRSV